MSLFSLSHLTRTIRIFSEACKRSHWLCPEKDVLWNLANVLFLTLAIPLVFGIIWTEIRKPEDIGMEID
jgi:hypothetical protein